MAKMTGLTGKLSGKMGSVVFRVRKGQQIVAQYNPVVTNRNTQSQQDTRAGFKLMSQLSSIMAIAIAIQAKGTSTARNEFFKKNFPLVETSGDVNDVSASIPMEELQLTDSFREFGSIELSTSNGGVNVSLTKSAGSPATGGKVVLVGYGTMGVLKNPKVLQIVDVEFDANGEVTHTFEGVGPGDYTVLAYGLIPSAGVAGNAALDNIHTPDDDPFTAAVLLQRAIANGSISTTMTVGANQNVPLT